MTIMDAIAQADALAPGNSFPEEMKVAWLSDLDGRVKEEIIDLHEGGKDIPFCGYSPDTPGDKELLVNEPYSELYIPYLLSKMDLYQDEITRYNNHTAVFLSLYNGYADKYNRTVTPLQKNRIRVKKCPCRLRRR